MHMEYVIPPPIHPMSKYIAARDEYYQVFPHISTVSDKHWAKRPGYKQIKLLLRL